MRKRRTAGRDQAPGPNCQGQTQEESNQNALECPAQYKSNHFRAAVSAKRHANTDFVSSLRNRVSEQAGEAG